MGTRAQLIERSIPFLAEIKNRTAGKELESWLNDTYGPRTPLYADLARLIKAGVEEGWAANIEIDGPHYRRSLVAPPAEQTHYFSITAVYYNSIDPYQGQYHQHPYGEVNLIMPIDPEAQMIGPNGWQGPGWTSPGPGSAHYPQARRGALISMFYLPAGRIDFDIEPPNQAD